MAERGRSTTRGGRLGHGSAQYIDMQGVAYYNLHNYNHYTLGDPEAEARTGEPVLQGAIQAKRRVPQREGHRTPTRHLEGCADCPRNNSSQGEVLPRWRTGAEASPTAAITAGRGELRRINPAQMAATLVEVVRHILRDTLHATSVRNELSEVADFGASIRLRDSAGIAEGRDALMEAVNILDEIVMNYDAAHDEFTMDPATLQDDLLRLAQQLQIVVPAHNNLLRNIRGELPSQRPSSNAQELYRRLRG